MTGLRAARYPSRVLGRTRRLSKPLGQKGAQCAVRAHGVVVGAEGVELGL
jgi:hypothetical protein